MRRKSRGRYHRGVSLLRLRQVCNPLFSKAYVNVLCSETFSMGMTMQGNVKHEGRRTQGMVGPILGLAGALLDFYSGYLLLVQSTMGMMAQSNNSGLVWGIGITAFGVVLVATIIGTGLTRGARKMAYFGALMVVYGVVMLFIGTAMYVGITSMSRGTTFPAFGMFLIGVLMVMNGAMMRRPPMM